MARLSELFNVNVFIVSQVNPHASLFASTGLGGGPVPKLIQFVAWCTCVGTDTVHVAHSAAPT